MRQPGFFDVDERLKRLSGLGDQFEAHHAVIDFERFCLDWEGRSAIVMAAAGTTHSCV